MAITAADVKKLRDATGAGMMDAKKALTEADGDFDAAVELLRVSGAAKVSKRADREASNGLVAGKGTSVIQLAAETDFVAKNAEFMSLADEIVSAVDAQGATDVESAKALKLASGQTVEEAVAELSARIGEKLELANVAHFEAPAATYLHRRSQDLPPQVGVLIEYTGGDDKLEFVRGIGMQIAAMTPQWLNRDEVPADVVANERHVAELTAREEGKPEKIIERIVEGRLGGFYKENTLLEQASVSDDKKSVGQLLKDNGVEVKRFVRFSTGG
ncbi:translation elongation factor Ts [Nigerium massiliense]|uniref:translation elongation factor Ts n=1 Tax=Nigerium massiliense TaxID=1522317 RepID=UPI00058D2DE9|nr:translation elongation factor Ts [Nigerium massiliense]